MVTRRLQFSGALFDGQSANKKPVKIDKPPNIFPSQFRMVPLFIGLIQTFVGLQKQFLNYSKNN